MVLPSGEKAMDHTRSLCALCFSAFSSRLSSLTCDFNMTKNYTHDWLLLVAAYDASPLIELAAATLDGPTWTPARAQGAEG